MKIVLLIISIFSFQAIFCQSLYFPTVGDGAQNPKAEYGYMEGIPLEVETDSIRTIYTDNGKIEQIKDQLYNYIVFPKKTGILTVTLISVENGVLDTTTSQIKVVDKPILKLVVRQQNDSILLNLIDSKGNNVTNDFYCSMEVEIIMNGSKQNYIMSNWEKWINYRSYFHINSSTNENEIIIKFNTTAVYSKKYDFH